MIEDRVIEISIADQQLLLTEGQSLLKQFTISTAKNGAGEQSGSECTPRGAHVICQKIGGDAEVGTVFVGREPTGEIYSSELAAQVPDRDWILTRILWLAGAEAGKNRFGDVDSQARFIYIHGCPDECRMGVPLSHGCIRMRNSDVIELYDLVEEGTPVLILESGFVV